MGGSAAGNGDSSSSIRFIFFSFKRFFSRLVAAASIDRALVVGVMGRLAPILDRGDFWRKVFRFSKLRNRSVGVAALGIMLGSVFSEE